MQTPAKIALAVCLLAGTATAQTRIYVDANITPSGDGSSWAKAYKSLSAALSAAKNGAEIWVATGSYSGGFVLKSNVKMIGGFRSGDTRMTQRVVGEYPAILDGGSSKRVLLMAQGSVVDGFFVRNGKAASPGGGGALILGATATIRNCAFDTNNISGGRGSALYCGSDGNGRRANPLVENTLFINNGKSGSGHVVDLERCDGTFRNVAIDRNNSNGLHMQSGCKTKIYNSAFTNNSGRGVCHIDAATSPIVENNHFFGNGVSHYHYRGSELRTIAAVNNLSYAKNNITGDPKYTDPSKKDYSLQASSPLIDKGQNFSGAALLDVDGNCRRLDGDRNGSAITDIGPIEYSNAYVWMVGAPQRGKTVTIELDGLNNTPAFMAISLGVASTPVFLPELGYVFHDSATGALYGWPVVGTDVKVTIPTNVPVGTSVLLQAAAGTSTWGNLSNPYDFRVQ